MRGPRIKLKISTGSAHSLSSSYLKNLLSVSPFSTELFQSERQLLNQTQPPEPRIVKQTSKQTNLLNPGQPLLHHLNPNLEIEIHFMLYSCLFQATFLKTPEHLARCYLARKYLLLVINIYLPHIRNVIYMHSYKAIKYITETRVVVCIGPYLFTNSYHLVI